MRGGLPLKAVIAVSAVLWCGAFRADDAALASPDTLAPKETVAYLQTAALGDVKDSLDAFGNAAIGMLYMQVGGQVDALQGSDVGKAIDWKRPLGVAFMAPAVKGGEPQVVFYVPETAAGALQKAVERSLAAAKDGENEISPLAMMLANVNLQSKGGYVICAEQGVKVPAPGGKAWKTSLKGTAVVSMDIAGLQRAFGPEISSGIREMETNLSQLPVPQGGANPAKVVKAELDLVRKLSRQSSRAEVSLDITEAHLALRTFLAPKPGTALEKLIAGQKPGIGRANLSAICGKGVWAAGELCWSLEGGLDPAKILSPIFEATGIAIDAAMQKRIRTICAEGGHQAYVATSQPEAAIGFTTLVTCADAQKAQSVIDSQCALLESMQQGGVSYKPVKSTGGAVRAYEMVCKADASMPQAAAILEALYGKSPTCGVGRVADKIVCAFGGDGQTRAARTMQDVEKGTPGTVPDWYKKLTESMPAGSQWRFGLGLLGTARFAGKTMEATTRANPFVTLDKMALEESGLGVYGFATRQGFETGLVIPTGTFALGQQLAMPLMMAGMGGRMQIEEEGPAHEEEEAPEGE